MMTLNQPVFSHSAALRLTIASKRRVMAHVFAAPPGYRVLKAVRSAPQAHPLKHPSLSRALHGQWTLRRCTSSWSRA